MPHAQVNGLSLCYETRGTTGTPLVMINGYAANIVNWLPDQVQQLSGTHRVVVFDNRGTGLSDKPTTAYSMADFAADTVGLMDVLGIDRAHVLGYSMGGGIAQHVAINYPTRVRSLMLLSTASVWSGHPKFVDPAPEVLAQLASPPSGDRAADIRGSWKRAFAQPYIDTHRDMLEGRLQALLQYPETPAHTKQLQYEAISAHDTIDRLPQIKCPTLVMTGTDDILVPAGNSRMLASLIPGARLIEYPGNGHGVLVQSGPQVIGDMLAFMAEVDWK